MRHLELTTLRYMIAVVGRCCESPRLTLPTAEILSGKNAQAWAMVSYLKKQMIIRILKESWEPLRGCLLNSTANPA